MHLELTPRQTGELLGAIVVSALCVQKWAVYMGIVSKQPPFELALGATIARILWTIKEAEEDCDG